MNPWRLWQQGFGMLAVSFVLGIATYVYRVIQISHLQRAMYEEGANAVFTKIRDVETSVVGQILNWSTIISFVVGIGLLLTGLISYCGKRARVETLRNS